MNSITTRSSAVTPYTLILYIKAVFLSFRFATSHEDYCIYKNDKQLEGGPSCSDVKMWFLWVRKAINMFCLSLFLLSEGSFVCVSQLGCFICLCVLRKMKSLFISIVHSKALFYQFYSYLLYYEDAFEYKRGKLIYLL